MHCIFINGNMGYARIWLYNALFIFLCGIWFDRKPEHKCRVCTRCRNSSFLVTKNCPNQGIWTRKNCLLVYYFGRYKKKQQQRINRKRQLEKWSSAVFMVSIYLITWEVENSCKIAVSIVLMRVNFGLFFSPNTDIVHQLSFFLLG